MNRGANHRFARFPMTPPARSIGTAKERARRVPPPPSPGRFSPRFQARQTAGEPPLPRDGITTPSLPAAGRCRRASFTYRTGRATVTVMKQSDLEDTVGDHSKPQPKNPAPNDPPGPGDHSPSDVTKSGGGNHGKK